MMDSERMEGAAWYRALTLTERTSRAILPNNRPHSARSLRRLDRWRSQPPFDTGALFAERLGADGVTQGDLLNLLDETPEMLRDRFPDPPGWLTRVAATLSRTAPEPSTSLPEVPAGEELLGFVTVVQPLVEAAREALRDAVRQMADDRSNLPFDPATVESLLFARVPAHLTAMLGRTMALELNVARLMDQLQGETPEERFRSFVNRLRNRDVTLGLLEEYPVLARQVASYLDSWVAFRLEFLERLAEDWDAVRSRFTEGDPGPLVDIDGDAGDSHCGGRSVLIAKFASGVRLVYKPRPLSAALHFQDLLSWLNQRGDHPPFRTLNILDKGTYGWIEFVEAKECESREEVARFYRRQGGYLALLYALEATDFHCENLIASGEHPVLLDLEALFHPRSGGMDLAKADDPAGSTINYSVLRVGLLPERIWGNEAHSGVNVSGLGSAEGELTPHPVPCWEGAGTDELRLQRKRVEMEGDPNRPTLNGAPVGALEYAVDILSGFEDLYRLLMDLRPDLLAERGPLAPFTRDEVRAVLRPTATYAALLRESFHPDVLRDALDRDRLFDRLWVWAEQSPFYKRVIPSERDDLWMGDIPIFTTRPDSRDLWDSRGRCIPGFFDEPAMDLARRRLGLMSEVDLAQQLWFVRASLATLSDGEGLAGSVETQTPGGDGSATGWAAQLRLPLPKVGRKRLLAAASAVGDRLDALALRGQQDRSWVGLTLDQREHWQLAPLETDLYDGLPGVALFLAYLGAVTGEQKYADLSRSALATFRRQIERGRQHLTLVGGFAGWGGMIYALLHLGVLWGEQTLVQEAEGFVELLPGLVEKDNQLDVISGSAGCIGSLAALYRYLPSERTLAAAIKCGEHLLAVAKPMDRGIGWIVPGVGPVPLAGFSHGAAGIAWALLKVTELSGEERFRAAALDAIGYERTLLSTEQGNWRDLRGRDGVRREESEQAGHYMVAWCHGAPGIGLARLLTLHLLDDREVRSEIQVALETTMANGFGGNHCLCHGDLGNLELLLEAARLLGSPWQERLDSATAWVMESIERNGWLCGNALRVESPGLMTGLAGIGYELLRLAEPDRVPSVLALAPPTTLDW